MNTHVPYPDYSQQDMTAAEAPERLKAMQAGDQVPGLADGDGVSHGVGLYRCQEVAYVALGEWPPAFGNHSACDEQCSYSVPILFIDAYGYKPHTGR